MRKQRGEGGTGVGRRASQTRHQKPLCRPPALEVALALAALWRCCCCASSRTLDPLHSLTALGLARALQSNNDDVDDYRQRPCLLRRAQHTTFPRSSIITIIQ